jgi:hypothetical protein
MIEGGAHDSRGSRKVERGFDVVPEAKKAIRERVLFLGRRRKIARLLLRLRLARKRDSR